MATTGELAALTKRITDAVASRADRRILETAQALLDIIHGAEDGEVSAWLEGLQRQAGYVNALCAAEGVLLRELPTNAPTLGDALEDWYDEGDYDRTYEAFEEAEAHMSAKAPGRAAPKLTRIYATKDEQATAFTIQVRMGGVPSDPDATVFWTELRSERSHPVAFAISSVVFSDKVDFRAERPPAPPAPGPLDRFHPERFATYHPSARTLHSMGRAMAQQPDKQLNQSDFQKIAQVIIGDAQSLLRNIPLREHGRNHLGSAPVTQAASLMSHIVQWTACGRQIFDLPPGLVERFLATDVDDVPLSLLRFPFPAFYIHWGKDVGIELEPGWYADGAYVNTCSPGVLQLVVTSVPDDSDALRWWSLKGEPYYYQAFDQHTLGMDVGTAVDTVLANELADLRRRASEHAMDLDAMLRDMIQSGEVDPAAASLHVEDVSARTAQQHIHRLTARHASYVRSLKLVINALCYLTAYPEDNEAAYPASAPLELVRIAASTDYKIAKRARGKLGELGYIPIHICGRELERQHAAAEGGHSVRAHWRRGHWRRQAHGEGRALRKLIWLMPVMVGRDDQAERPGHLYLVS